MPIDLLTYELKYKNNPEIIYLIEEYKSMEAALHEAEEMRIEAEDANDKDLNEALEKLREIKELVS